MSTEPGSASLADAAMVIAGRDGLVAWASPGVTSVLGYPATALVGQPIEQLVPSDFRKRHMAGWRSVWRSGRMSPPTRPVMIPVVRADGVVHHFASHLVPIRAPHGELLAVAAVWMAQSDADAGVAELQ
jgi:PAS domain S-box-containing protein